jgi:hypothetical protein
VAVSCECGIEPQGSIKLEEFIEWLRAFYFLKNDSASCSYLVCYLHMAVKLSVSIKVVKHRGYSRKGC